MYMEILRRICESCITKNKFKCLPTKKHYSLYLLFNTTIIASHDSKISLIFFWGSCHFLSNKSIFLQILYPSSVSWKITPLYFFSSNNIFSPKRSSLKWKSLRLSSTQVKICQIPYANFKTTSRFLSKFFIPLQFHER